MIVLYILGLYKLQIKHNPLADIPEEAFLGLERSLWELDLSYNQLASVPSKSFRHLQKLRLLELTGTMFNESAFSVQFKSITIILN